MTDAENVLRLQALFSEAERERDLYPLTVRLLVWAGCFVVNLALWTVIVYGAARAIDLARNY